MLRRVLLMLLIFVFVFSVPSNAIQILGFGESDETSVVTVIYNGESYWIEEGKSIGGYVFEGLINKQGLFIRNETEYLVNVGGTLDGETVESQTADSATTTKITEGEVIHRQTGVDTGNIGPINVPDNWEILWTASSGDLMEDMNPNFIITYDDFRVAANTTAPSDGSYYIQDGGEYVIEVNTFGGVEWTIEIINAQ